VTSATPELAIMSKETTAGKAAVAATLAAIAFGLVGAPCLRGAFPFLAPTAYGATLILAKDETTSATADNCGRKRQK
jgi:hypothetical protein